MARRIYIDANNVIRGNVSLDKIEEQQGSVAAGRHLLRLVRELAKRAGGRAEWIVVFDGPSDDAAAPGADSAVQAIFAEGRSADEIIVEMANDAVAVGHEVAIVSNDAEVRADGASAMRAEEFYAELISREPHREPKLPLTAYEELLRRPPAPDPAGDADAARRLIVRLVELGFLPASAIRDPGLVGELARELLRCAIDNLPPQKIGKRLEPFFRQRLNVRPDPDPQKKLQRAIKDAIEK
jgi:hypothetical protein